MNQTASLYRLQTIDHQINQLSNQIAKIESRLSDDSEKKRLLEELSRETTALHNLSQEVKEIAFHSSALKIKIEQSESSLYSGGIKNPKELQDLQNEISSLKKQLTISEENELEKMIMLDAQQGTTIEKQTHYDEFLTNKTISDQELSHSRSSMVKDLEVLVIEREATEKSLQQNFLELYNRLRKQKAGIAVVSVEENACSSCGAEISQAEWQKARINPEMVFCQGCGRIIYAN